MKPWLFKILTNTCLDRLRSRARLSAARISGDHHMCDDFPSLDRRPDELVGDRELSSAIEVAIQRLPLVQQVVVQLIIVEQCSYAQAAQVLDLPIGTVRSRLNRARESLMRFLASWNDAFNDEARAPRLRVVR